MGNRIRINAFASADEDVSAPGATVPSFLVSAFRPPLSFLFDEFAPLQARDDLDLIGKNWRRLVDDPIVNFLFPVLPERLGRGLRLL